MFLFMFFGTGIGQAAKMINNICHVFSAKTNFCSNNQPVFNLPVGITLNF